MLKPTLTHEQERPTPIHAIMPERQNPLLSTSKHNHEQTLRSTESYFDPQGRSITMTQIEKRECLEREQRTEGVKSESQLDKKNRKKVNKQIVF